MHQNRQIPRIYKFARIASIAKFTIFVRITRSKAEKQSKDALEKLIIYKGADLFQKGGRTKKQAAGRGTSRYSIGIKSWPELISN